MTKIRARALIALASLAAIHATAQAGVHLVALSGSSAPLPGYPTAYYSSFAYDPVASGGTAFQSFIGTTDYKYASYANFYVTPVGDVATLAMPKGLAPDCGGATFSSVDAPAAGRGGDFVFAGSLTGTGVTSSNMEGLFAGPAGALRLVVRRGNTAPGAAGRTFYTFTDEAINSDGKVAFKGQLNSSSTGNFGVWSSIGGVHLVMRQDDASPIAGLQYGQVMGPPAIGSNGVAVLTQLAGTGVNSDNDMALISESGGAVHVVARDGNAAAGLPGWVYANMTTLNRPSVNDNGSIAFVSHLTRADLQPGVQYGIFVERPGQGVRNVVVTDQPAPGTGGGVFNKYGGISAPLLNNSEQMLFDATVWNGTSDEGIFRVNTDGTDLRALFLDSTHAVGLPSNVTYSFFYESYFNERGQAAVVANLSTGRRAIFATQLDGSQALIAYEGQQIEIAPGVNKTIDLLYWPGTAGTLDGLPTMLSDTGAITFKAVFTDSTSAVLTSDVVVPEPATLACLATAIPMLTLRRRRLAH